MNGSPLVPFEYAILRAVPRIDRGESINVGVLVHCRDRDFIGGRAHVDVRRLRALDAAIDCSDVERAATAASDCTLREAQTAGQRFRWLTAARSTVIQPGPVHTGLTADPAADLDRLFTALVLPPADPDDRRAPAP